MTPALITPAYNDIETVVENLLRERDVIEPDPPVSASFDTRKEAYFDRWRGIAAFCQREWRRTHRLCLSVVRQPATPTA